MHKKRKMIFIPVEISNESFEDFSKGKVSRGAIHMDEEGFFKFVRYNLGEGRKIGPRKQLDLSQSTLYELMEAILAKFNLKNKGGANADN